MKNIRFTQTIVVSVLIGADVPDDWDDSEVQQFADDFVVTLTVNEPDDPTLNGDDFALTDLILDSANLNDVIVWDS